MPLPVEFKFDFDKFLAVVHYLASRNVPELTKYKIVKLIFFADKYHTVRYGRPIIGDRYCALPHGPVPSAALDLLDDFLRYPVSEEDQVARMRESLSVECEYPDPRFAAKVKPTPSDLSVLSASDIGALNHAIEQFGTMDFGELKAITHNTYAYRNAEPNQEMSYEDFFIEDPDAIDGALAELCENDSIRRELG